MVLQKRSMVKAEKIKNYGLLSHTYQFPSKLYRSAPMSDDAHADRNAKLKAAMRQKETPLNKGPAQVPCAQPQVNGTKMPTNHIDPGTGKRS
jgi:hypothetical protein